MNQNILYRSYKQFKEELHKNPVYRKDHKEFEDISNLSMSSMKYEIIIEKDWILEIESRLEYVSKAIKEERQFIISNGEVIPIEKAKKVSKESVKHLAQHSNLISHYDEDDEDDIKPDKIYMVEKLSDFAVYENRFLYMLLIYLKEFINSRYNKINDLLSYIKNEMELSSINESKKNNFDFKLKLKDERYDNKDYLIDEVSLALFSKIKDLALVVNSLLNTPLMQEVSKSPMIKPPITKTNVLKMNNNFKNAVALYEFISSFEGKGYEVKEIIKNVNNTNIQARSDSTRLDEIACLLTKYYAEDISSKLEDDFLKFQDDKKIKENDENLRRLSLLKERLTKEEIDPYEYISKLEQLNQKLEDEHNKYKSKCEKLAELEDKFSKLDLDVKNYKNENINLQIRVDSQKEELETIKIKHQEELDKLISAHEEEINNLNESHEDELKNLNATHEEEVSRLTNEYESRIEEIKEDCDSLIDSNNKQTEELTQRYEKELEEIEAKIEKSNLEAKSLVDKANLELEEEKEKLNIKLQENEEYLKNTLATKDEQLNLANAKVLAIEAKYNEKTLSDDFTSKEDFEALELQYKAFTMLFKGQWKKTKKKIREEYFWNKKKDKK